MRRLFLLVMILIFSISIPVFADNKEEREVQLSFKGAYLYSNFIGSSYAAGVVFKSFNKSDRGKLRKMEFIIARGSGNNQFVVSRRFVGDTGFESFYALDSFLDARWQFLGKYGWGWALNDRGHTVFINIEALGGSTKGITERFDEVDTVTLSGREEAGDYVGIGVSFDLEIPLMGPVLLNPEIAYGRTLYFSAPWPQDSFFGRPAYYRGSLGVLIRF